MNAKKDIDPFAPTNDLTGLSRAAWMREGKFGLMVHWIHPAVPPKDGEKETDFQRAVDAFDLDLFLSDFDKTQADWLVFTIGQNTGCYASHNQTAERLLGPGHTSQRDLVMEIARQIKARNKRFIAYLPCIVTHASDDLRTLFGWTGEENTTPEVFCERYSQFIRDFALRFGTLLDGWWFDGALEAFHYPQICNQPFMEAARAGNPMAAVAFNDGAACVGSTQATEGQDYMAGETEVVIGGKIRNGRASDAPLLDPRNHRPAPPASCLWHALVPIDCYWGHGNSFLPEHNLPVAVPPYQAGRMEPPLYSTADLATLVSDFKAAGGGVTFNVGIFQEGGLGPETVDQLNELAGLVGKDNKEF